VDGVHDLGGIQGFGPVVREENEPAFHASWEPAVVALMRAARAHGVFNLDEFRHAIERMPPDRYLSASYYERWFEAVSRLVVEKGVVTADELERRAATAGTDEAPSQARERSPDGGRSAHAGAALVTPITSVRQETRAPAYRQGDAIVTVRTRNRGHTRLPRYARGKRGVVRAYYGFHVFPDANAHGRGEDPQPLYSVRFEGSELWGDGGGRSQAVYLDLWESYLLPAGAKG
jgi:nitrile hydratase